MISRASGNPWKQVAADAGVDPATIHRWRHEYNLDALVSQVVRDTTQEGMLLLTSRFKKAAQIVADYVDGEIESEPVGESGVSYAKAHLRYQAAKETMARVMRAWEYSEQLKGIHATGNARANQRGKELSPAELIAAARAARERLKLGTGKGNR